MGYATDLGTWDDDLVRHLADVDVLALEFNHDVEMQRASGRPKLLIDRVLSERGHLSNNQACELLRAARAQSANVGLRYMVGLHASQQCNRPELARAAACDALGGENHAIKVIFATQHEPTPIIEIRPASDNAHRPGRHGSRAAHATSAVGFFDENT
jgi:phosphoribosyl 1,2-cyclic phosphodiesterase